MKSERFKVFGFGCSQWFSKNNAKIRKPLKRENIANSFLIHRSYLNIRAQDTREEYQQQMRQTTESNTSEWKIMNKEQRKSKARAEARAVCYGDTYHGVSPGKVVNKAHTVSLKHLLRHSWNTIH